MRKKKTNEEKWKKEEKERGGRGKKKNARGKIKKNIGEIYIPIKKRKKSNKEKTISSSLHPSSARLARMSVAMVTTYGTEEGLISFELIPIRIRRLSKPTDIRVGAGHFVFLETAGETGEKIPYPDIRLLFFFFFSIDAAS